tara:strand:- start:557 stop:1408 length:852 start_codon:yes stop_codon:yes gene_type:complete
MRLAISILLFCLSVLSMASSLPPEHESARLLLVIEEAVSRSDWQLADENLSKMADLDVELPVSFFFYNGRVHFKQKRIDKAQRSLEHYVIKAGPSGEFYYDALRLLTAVERETKEQAKHGLKTDSLKDKFNPDGSESGEPLLVNHERDAYVQSLQALFLTESPVQALVMQINSLLSAHPFTGSRIKKAYEKKGVKFQVSTQDNMIVLQERDFQNGYPQLSAVKLEVSGIDPFIRFDCSNKNASCWLYHPSDKHEKWLLVDNDELVAAELSQAFTRLIQSLQQK